MTQLSQQDLKARKANVAGHCDPLELDEASKAIDPIEVNPHAFEEEKPPRLAHNGSDAQGARKCLL